MYRIKGRFVGYGREISDPAIENGRGLVKKSCTQAKMCEDNMQRSEGSS